MGNGRKRSRKIRKSNETDLAWPFCAARNRGPAPSHMVLFGLEEGGVGTGIEAVGAGVAIVTL